MLTLDWVVKQKVIFKLIFDDKNAELGNCNPGRNKPVVFEEQNKWLVCQEKKWSSVRKLEK